MEKWYPVVGDLRLDVSINWNDSPDCKSGCKVTEPYLLCELEFSPTRVIAVYTSGETGEIDYNEVEKEVIHECAHTIAWRAIQRLEEAGVTVREAELYEEQITTMIERGVWKAYKMGLDEATK